MEEVVSKVLSLRHITGDLLQQCLLKSSYKFKDWPQHVSLFMSDRSNMEIVEAEKYEALKTLSSMYAFFTEVASLRLENALDVIEKQTILLSHPERLEAYAMVSEWNVIIQLLPKLYELCLSVISEIKKESLSVGNHLHNL